MLGKFPKKLLKEMSKAIDGGISQIYSCRKAPKNFPSEFSMESPKKMQGELPMNVKLLQDLTKKFTQVLPISY